MASCTNLKRFNLLPLERSQIRVKELSLTTGRAKRVADLWWRPLRRPNTGRTSQECRCSCSTAWGFPRCRSTRWDCFRRSRNRTSSPPPRLGHPGSWSGRKERDVVLFLTRDRQSKSEVGLVLSIESQFYEKVSQCKALYEETVRRKNRISLNNWGHLLNLGQS